MREFRQSQRIDDDEDKKDTRALVGAGGSGNVAVIESTAQPSSSQSGDSSSQSELAATKARLAAAEARLRQLEESAAKSQGAPQG